MCQAFKGSRFKEDEELPEESKNNGSNVAFHLCLIAISIFGTIALMEVTKIKGMYLLLKNSLEGFVRHKLRRSLKKSYLKNC